MQKYETISLTSYDHLENTLEIYNFSYIQKYLCLRQHLLLKKLVILTEMLNCPEVFQ